MKQKVLIKIIWLALACNTYHALATDSLVIQENTLGICTMDGIVESSQAGYTGEGYINVDNGLNIGVSWSLNATTAGSYNVLWRYALGGGDTTSRNAVLYVNNVMVDTIIFKHSPSGSWSEWKITDTATVDIDTGRNSIRLASITSMGLANIDKFVIYGSGFTMSQCIPTYTLSVMPDDPLYGTVSYSPIQDLYDVGTEITVTANATSGHFFHSWSGEESSTLDTFIFNIMQNTNLTAMFYEDGVTMAEGANGYASIQHDNGTPYLLTGGNLGETVEPETVDELRTYLGATEPLVINISKHFVGMGEIGFASNKTLIGTNDSAHIEGIMMSVANLRNVIIKNITFSKVITKDEMEINGAKNIWIDHCEFYTDRDHDKDYYDGLLDIKNASSWITVSWCNFHDHHKSILISSGDDSYQDSVQRITFHHNYFHECGSRLPSIRFGKSHIFSNYYENNDGAINSRVGACVKIEHNYFKSTSGAIGQTGEAYIDMEPNTNIFISSSYVTTIPPCVLEVPYTYDDLVDSASTLPDLIPAGVRVFQETTAINPSISSIKNSLNLQSYPNPCNDFVTISFRLLEPGNVTIDLYNIMGKHMQQLASNRHFTAGLNEVKYNISTLREGIYMYHFISNDISITGIIQKIK